MMDVGRKIRRSVERVKIERKNGSLIHRGEEISSIDCERIKNKL